MYLSRFLLCCALVLSNAMAADQRVLWLRSDFPPISIVNGPYADQGSADRWMTFFMAEMKDYRHEVLTANTARKLEEMKRRSNACNVAFLKTPEREKIYLFSEPLTLFLPSGVVVLRRRQAEFKPFLNGEGELRLAQMMASRGFDVAVAAGRSFGQVIDPALKSMPDKLVEFNASDVFTSGLLQLVGQKGVDAVVGYAMEIEWSTRRLSLPADQFRFLPVEGETTPIPVYIGCSRSVEGQRIVDRINALIRRGEVTELAARAYRDWLPEEVGRYYDQTSKATAKRSKP